ncbi:MAG: hypothetical protein IPO37_03575 [Saprospiraceae bacterium]|nr:hypothetical protein [Saprospiraceae bacterium]
MAINQIDMFPHTHHIESVAKLSPKQIYEVRSMIFGELEKSYNHIKR